MTRVWDRYLTEQDRAHLARFAPRRIGFGDRPALLLVDCYEAAFGDRPEPLLDAIARWPSSCGPAAWVSLPHLQRLLASCREAGIPVVHVTGPTAEAIAERPEGWSMKASYGSAASLDPTPAVASYEIVEPLAPAAGESVFRKETPSPFWATPIDGHLRRHGVDTLVVCGESTSGCVRATVVDAITHGFRVVVPEECVFDRHEASHALSLFDMHQKYADVLALDDVLRHLDPERRPYASMTKASL